MTPDTQPTHSRMRPQVDADTHYSWDYLNLIRAITHWHQANEVIRTTRVGDTVVEIGPGSGHVTWLLRRHRREVLTVDLDPRIRPTVAASIDALPLADGSAATVLAAEVLEHLPFEQAKPAVKELARVARENVIITLPAPLIGLAGLLNPTRFAPRGFAIGVPYKARHRFQGEHYWELGKLGYSKHRVRRLLLSAGLSIVREFRPFPSLYCYFFVASKIRKR